MVVVGAGGHAKVIVDCLRTRGWNVVGCTDSDPTPRQCAGAPVIGSDEKLPQLLLDGITHAFCALGDNALRERIGVKLLSLGFKMPFIVAPSSTVSSLARIEAGVAVLPGAVINADSVLSKFTIVNTNASVDHDCVLGRAVHIGPGSTLAGEVHVGDRTFIATGSSVIPQRRIGADCLIGAGSVVIRDIPAAAVAFGNPARIRSIE